MHTKQTPRASRETANKANRRAKSISKKASKRIAKPKKDVSKSKKRSKAFKDDIKRAVDAAKELVKKALPKRKKRRSGKQIAEEERQMAIEAMEASFERNEEFSDLEGFNDAGLAQIEAQATAKLEKKSKKPQAEAPIAFFYTNDKYFNLIDDAVVLEAILQKYPDFMREDLPEQKQKDAIVALILDKKFVKYLLECYSLSMYDFFKVIFRGDTTVFRGPFLSKLQRTLRDNGYTV